MKIGGFQKTSLIEYPGRLSCVVFLQGCNLRCPFCHNPELVLPERFSLPIDAEEIKAFLDKRKKYLEGVVITGGEPCFAGVSLLGFMKTVKEKGYLVKLDTNGTFPGILEEALNSRLVDYIAMDIKGPLEKYSAIAGVAVKTEDVEKSVALVKSSGVEYEFRTTVVKDMLSFEDFQAMGRLVKGARLYCLQRFAPSMTIAPEFVSRQTYSDEEFEVIKGIMLQYVRECRVR